MRRFLALLLFFCSTIWAFCPPDNFEFQNSCYKIQQNALQYFEAELECNSHSGNLISIHDGFLNAKLQSELVAFFPNNTISIWIGLNKLTNPNNWTWTDGTVFDFSEWANSQQKNIPLCASFLNYQWFVESCVVSKPYACKVNYDETASTSSLPIKTTSTTSAVPTLSIEPTISSCPENWDYFELTQSCYLLMDNAPTTWTGAEETCKSVHSHLVSIHSYEEAAYVAKYGLYIYFNNPRAPESLWIGLYSDDSEVSWQWTDGSPLDYLLWNDRYPYGLMNSSRAYIDTDDTFYDGYDNDNMYFVCKMYIGAPPISPTTVPSHGTYCSKDWVYFEKTHSCYGMMQTMTYNWTFAEGICQCNGANLASIHTAAEADFISEYATNATWIGLYSVDHTSIGYTWQWTDGSQVDFLPFADQPVYQRVYFLDNKFWDFDKTQKLNFICKKMVR